MISSSPAEGHRRVRGTCRSIGTLCHWNCISAASRIARPLPSRLYRPCRSSQSLHSLRIECFRREGHGHSDGDLLGGEVRLRGAVAVEERVLQQPRSGAHDPVEFEAAARLLLQAILIRSFDVLKCLTVRETLTISLPKELRRGLEKMAKAEGVTSSEYVRRAIKADIFRRALRAARRELVPQARAQGIYTDEDVFKIVS